MTRRERWTLILIWLGLGLLPLLVRPLWEPDEARYAEIPREMLATGDWLTPRLNGVLYFEKPPFQYWLSAISMKLFGVNGAAARLPLALASALMIWAAWRLARRLGARQPIWAPFMAATCLLGFLVGQILTLDALFSAFVVSALVASLEAVSERVAGRPGTAWTFVSFVLVSAAFLTKGVAALALLGPALLASLWYVKGRPALKKAVLATAFSPWGWLLAAVLTAPWFILVDRANPGHAWFFFIHEHIARFATHEAKRQGSDNWFLDKLYFLGVLGLGLLPWLSACVTGLRRGWAFLRSPGPQAEDGGYGRWAVALALLAFAWPLAFFSVSGSKLPPYILPVVVPLAALACAFEREGEEGRALARMGKELGILALVFLAAGLAFAKDLSGGQGWILALAAALGLLALWAHRPGSLTDPGWKVLTGPRLMVALAGSLWLLVQAAQTAAGPGKSVAALVRSAPAGAQWISYGSYHQGIAFYARTRCVVVAGTGELAYGRDHLGAEAGRWFDEDPAALGAVADRMKAADPRPVVVLASRGAWKRLTPGELAGWEELQRSPAGVLARRR
jgi:4-amino-4-deoxy-L-arabinose transferase-like glycosyltransferase